MSRTKIELAQSKRRQRLSELLRIETRSDDETAEMARLADEVESGEVELRAAILAEPDAKPETGDAPDPDRVELRAAAKVGDYMAAVTKGVALEGAAAELNAELGLGGREIPMEIFEPAKPVEERAATTAPAAGTGQNLRPIAPYVFAASVAPMLGIEMPSVGPGGYGAPLITAPLEAEAKAKGQAIGAQEATLAIRSMTPKRVSARLTWQTEDALLMGSADFEAALRRNLQAALSDQLDTFLLNDATASEAPEGVMGGLGAVTAATETVTYSSAIETFAELIDGLWARSLSEIRALVNAAVMQKLEALLQVPLTSGANGEKAVAQYLRDAMAGLASHHRMPDSASNVGTGLAFRAGNGLAERPAAAVCANWGRIEITDPYSDSAKATTHVTAHVFVSDVKVLYPAAYSLFSIKTA